jgi:hypothetical protein
MQYRTARECLQMFEQAYFDHPARQYGIKSEVTWQWGQRT